jgi:purine nucleosidase/pyrimidine-specific ribonucleoside hydrolase
MSIPCILDCDPGHDDAIAILLAAGHPAIDLRAITTVGGNGALDKVTYNARRICTLANIRDVPIAAGADRPLAGEHEPAADVHGESALDGPELPEPDVPLDAHSATALIEQTLQTATEPVTILATGPLTNVAIALDHVDTTRIREIVWMGGSSERGNRMPYAEFNAWADPEAAAQVVASGVPVTVIGLNLTHQALATDAVVARILALGTPLAETVAGWLTFFGDTSRTLFGFPAPPVHDPCAVALVADPATMSTADAFVAIETEGTWTRGATVIDLDRRLPHPPNARVALELDFDRFWDLVVDAIDRLGR